MADKVYNPGFAFYQNFYTSIEHLPLEQQKEVCYAIVKYGITNEMVDPIEMPIGYSMTSINLNSINESIERWKNNVGKANNNSKKEIKLEEEREIAELISQGYKSPGIAKILGISESKVRKSNAWKQREDNSVECKNNVIERSENVPKEQNGTELEQKKVEGYVF